MKKSINLKELRDGHIVYRRVELYLYIFQDLEKLKPAVLIPFTTLV